MAAGPAAPRVDFDSDELDLRLQMQFPADPLRVTDVTDSIMKMIGAMECAHGHEDEIRLGMQEALANAVVHGAGSDPTKMVECRVACEERHGMLIIVSDPGEGFDLTKVADPLHAQNLFSNHGRGIYLINHLMDEVEYKRGGTEIHMRKRLDR